MIGMLLLSALTGFTRLPGAPNRDALLCGNYSREWYVSAPRGEIDVRAEPLLGQPVKLPFPIRADQDHNGLTDAVKVSDGWLAGFDAGEFGGGLTWFSPDGKKSRRIHPPSDAPAAAADPFRAENVHGFVRFNGDLLVFMGLDHMGGESGRIFRTYRKGDQWELAPYAVLDATPAAWLLDRDRLLVLTRSGLWEKRGSQSFRKAWSADIGIVSPTSMARASDGSLYIGMRRFIVGLAETNGRWSATWFVPSECVKAEVRDLDCVCLP